MFSALANRFHRSLGWRISVWYACGFTGGFLLVGAFAFHVTKEGDLRGDREEIQEEFEQNAARCRRVGVAAFATADAREPAEVENTLLLLSDKAGSPAAAGARVFGNGAGKPAGGCQACRRAASRLANPQASRGQRPDLASLRAAPARGGLAAGGQERSPLAGNPGAPPGSVAAGDRLRARRRVGRGGPADLAHPSSDPSAHRHDAARHPQRRYDRPGAPPERRTATNSTNSACCSTRCSPATKT